MGAAEILPPRPLDDLDPAAARTIASRLGAIGSARVCGADAAFPITSSDAAWLVLEGHVDLFWTPGPARVRHHMLRVHATEMLLGLAAPSLDREGADESSFLAVPTNGTRLVAVDLRALREPAHSPEWATVAEAIVRPLLDAWRGLVALPLDCRRLEAGATVSVKAGEPVAAAGPDIVWATLDSGGFAHGLRGRADAAVIGPAQEETSTACVPLDDAAWWRARRDATVTALSLATWLERPTWFDELREVQTVTLRALVQRRKDEHARKLERIERSEQRQAQELRGSLDALTQALEPRGEAAADSSQAPLAQATEIVCRQKGFAFRLPEGESWRLASGADPVRSLAEAAGCFVRSVTLPSRWWRRDGGPLLGFRGAERSPCALLPRPSGRGYVLVDPASDARAEVDEHVAASVASDAYDFQRPLPDQPIGGLDLLRFASHGVRRDLWTIVGTTVAVGLLALVLPVLTGWMIDPVIPEADVGQLWVLSSALFLAGASSVTFSLVQSIAMVRLEGAMGNVAQVAVWDRLLKMPISFFRDFTVGDLVNRTQGVDQIRNALGRALTESALRGVASLLSLALLLYYDWRLGLGVLGVVSLYVVLAVVVGRGTLRANRALLDLTGRVQGLTFQLLSAVPKLRVAGAERSAFAMWAERYARLLGLFFRVRFFQVLLAEGRSIAQILATFTVVLILSWQTGTTLDFFHTATTWGDLQNPAMVEVMPAARFVSFNVALGQFLAGVFSLTTVAVQLTSVGPILDRTSPILRSSPERWSGGCAPRIERGDVEFTGVKYRYHPDGPLVLDGMSFRAASGSLTALVGPSGAGKSTIVRLLLGFDVPEAGSIFLDGQDIQKIDRKAMRRTLGVVLQDSRLLAGTLLQNITAGTDATLDDAWEAARLAGLAPDIEAMPMGMHTILSEGATTLSGGQRQRVMVARALVRRPRILLFDEATSALDNETQAHVTENVARLNATRIVIAHRLSTIEKADWIYFIDDGRVVEGGRYRDLLERGGRFWEMARRQRL